MTGTECTQRTTRTPRPRERPVTRAVSQPRGEWVERTAETGRDGSAITPNIYVSPGPRSTNFSRLATDFPDSSAQPVICEPVLDHEDVEKFRNGVQEKERRRLICGRSSAILPPFSSSSRDCLHGDSQKRKKPGDKLASGGVYPRRLRWHAQDGGDKPRRSPCGANAQTKLPGPRARTLKSGKPGWRLRSASAVGYADLPVWPNHWTAIAFTQSRKVAAPLIR